MNDKEHLIGNEADEMDSLECMLPYEKAASSSEPVLRLVLLGKTGAGKSATGNTILGRNVFPSEISPEAVTERCRKESGHLGGRRIEVIDTPGIFGSTNSKKGTGKNSAKKETILQIKECVHMSCPGPHAFLLVIRLGRFTEEEKKAVEWIQENFGKEASLYTIVLFTHSDQLGRKSLADFISKSEDLQELTKLCDNRYHAFSNLENSGLAQVTQLLEIVDKMVKLNGGHHYTNEMFQKIQRKIQLKKTAKDVTLGVVMLAGGAGAVAGGALLLAEAAVVLPAAAVAVGSVTAVGTGAKLLYDKATKKHY